MPQRRNTPELKLLYGVEAHDRVDDRPQAIAREPERPAVFTSAERRLWTHVLDELRQMGTLSSADTQEIVLYVRTVVMLERVHVELTRSPLTFANEQTGAVHANPLVAMYERLAGRAHTLASSLGLSPHGRSLIHGRTTVVADTEAAHVKDLYA